MTNRTMTRRDFGSKVITVSAAAAAASLAAPAVLGAAKARVVVIGGGAGGGTVARYVAKGSDDIAVTLINDSPTYSTCFFSNLYLGGFLSFESTTHSYDTLAADYGIVTEQERTGVNKVLNAAAMTYVAAAAASVLQLLYWISRARD